VKILKFKNEAHKAARKLLAEARENEPLITKDLKAVAKLNKAQLVGLENRFKNGESLIRKLIDKSKRWNSSIAKEAKRNNDTLRYTMIFSTEEYMKGYNQVLSELEAKSYEVRKIFNAWETEGKDGDVGYRGINVTVISSQKQKFELRFHTKESFQIKTETHVFYEEFRNFETSNERKAEIQQIMLKYASQIKRPEGI
jgi:hypothetical protein